MDDLFKKFSYTFTDLTKFQVGIGSNNRSRQTLISIESIHLHHQYDDHNSKHDIALVRTRDPLLHRHRTGMIFLPFPPKRDPIDPLRLTILGWGREDSGVKNQDKMLREGAMKQIRSHLCDGIYTNQPIYSGMICLLGTYSDGASACRVCCAKA